MKSSCLLLPWTSELLFLPCDGIWLLYCFPLAMICGSCLTCLSPGTPLPPPPARNTMLFWVIPALFELLWLLCLLLLLRLTAFLSFAPTEYPLTFCGDYCWKLNKIGPFPFCCAAVVVMFPSYFGAPLGWPYLKKESVLVLSFNYLASFYYAM